MGRSQRREEIIEVASRLFHSQGYAATTIRDIAEQAGLLSGSLYAHIQSKEDLLYEISCRGADAFLTAITPIVTEAGTAEEKLRRALAAHAQVVADHLEAATVFFHEWKALSFERREKIQAKRDEYEVCWSQIIVSGMETGEFRQEDEKFIRLLLLSVANWMYEWYRPDGELPPRKIADRYADILLEGLATKKKGG
ncbi:TetR/AcrR family transcriptional regulator [Mechercharimyces sp. CAU 1602]|uniref:TetR/AcrR family transcriptional regulator n=1 Tax=Mechercharimyces sp. CAU 1602 TaxID=2973933 RepID=UPI002161BE6C|nr:TetR/AcrR family transcriptional regulator [Mechercharimyces sp. CAU 1602]MCS1351730.1 TetR/AcrR family transcriptional regulator [Mechercharimyces sp. CAU 1602]